MAHADNDALRARLAEACRELDLVRGEQPPHNRIRLPDQPAAQAVAENHPPPVPEDEWRKPETIPKFMPPPPKKVEIKTPPSVVASAAPAAPSTEGGAGFSGFRSIAQVSQLPHFKVKAKPLYPEAAKHANIEGFVILQVDIDATGADPIEYVKAMLAQKKKIPGFGHRVYHTEDPRATHLRQMSRDLGHASGDPKWFEMSQKIEDFVKAEKKLNANVDFYSASTYHTLGIDVDLFTPIFAVSRVGGWTAHVIEQLDDNRLIRPRADYIGPVYPQKYVAVENR